MLKLASVLAPLGVLAACESSTSPNDDFPLNGVIVQTGHGLWSGSADGPFQIWVKKNPGEECGIIFSVDDGTLVFDTRGGGVLRADATVLSDSAKVTVWYELLLDSCPGQSYAESVARIE